MNVSTKWNLQNTEIHLKWAEKHVLAENIQ